MKAKWIIAACLLVTVAVAANATDKPHTVVKGDTLWDISDQYKSDPFYWPNLWSHNPQVHNPHWIYPGETIYFGADRPAPAPTVREVRLPLVRLVPESKVEEVAAGGDDAMQSRKNMLSLSERRAQDYISAERVVRLGTVDSPRYAKEIYAASEEVEFIAVDGSGLKAGDMVTLFNDTRPIMHPNTGGRMGFHVDVVGYAKVVEVGEGGDRGRIQITKTYDTVSDGYGLMSYREPVVMVEVTEAPLEMNGFVVAGDRPFMLFSEFDAVFLDKGGDDGLKPGMMLSMPIPEESSVSEGFSYSFGRPVATVVVVSTEAATSTAFIINSDRAVLAGQRFVASADSP